MVARVEEQVRQGERDQDDEQNVRGELISYSKEISHAYEELKMRRNCMLKDLYE